MCRKLTAEEIECRVGQKTRDGSKYSVLLYKTSRTDMAILDETYGPMNWQCSYQTVGNSLYCTISVFDEEKGIWISKQSNGSESNVEAEKGQASDAFKRAGFLFGIGRELYSAPQIWLKSDISPYDLSVKEIGYDANSKISRLVIVAKNEVVYELGKYAKTSDKKIVIGKSDTVQQSNGASKEEMLKRLTEAGTNMINLCSHYNVGDVNNLTIEQLTEACKIKGV